MSAPENRRVAGKRRFAVCFVLVALTVVSRAGAQLATPQEEGIPIGRVIFYPSLAVEITEDSNVFYTSSELPDDQVIDSRILLVRPRLLFDLPFGESSVRWAYSPTYRDYSSREFQQSDKISHFLDVDADLRIGRSVGLRIRDHLVEGTVELREIDPGGELTFGLTPFSSQDAAIELTFDLGARHGFSLTPSYSEVRFDEPEGAAVFFDFDKSGLEAQYFVRTGSGTKLYTYYEFQDTDQERDQSLFEQVDEAKKAFGLGFRRLVNQSVVTALSAGYSTRDYEGGGESDFHGIVFDGRAQWRLREGSVFSATVNREAFQSFFINNNFYVSTRFRVQIARQLGRRLFWQAAVGAYFNRYSDPIDISTTDPAVDQDMDGNVDGFESYEPSIGVTREDDVYSLQLGVGYQMRRSVRAIAGFDYDRRSSNIMQRIESTGDLVDPFNTRVHRFFLRLEMGWL